MIEETLPGVAHWSATHPNTGGVAHSTFVLRSGTLIDPMEPEDGPEAIEALTTPRRIVLTNRHHLRAAERLAERWGLPILAHRDGLGELPDGVEGFTAGHALADDVLALEFGALTPEEVVLHIDAAGGILSFADGLIRRGDGELGFVSDRLLGEDPETVRRDLRDALAALLDQQFAHLFFAHGEPLLHAGRDALTTFLARP